MRSLGVLLASLVFLVACPPSPQGNAKPPPKPGRGPENVVPELPAADACADAPLVTLEQIADGAHAGERVALEVVPRAAITCTLLACVTTVYADEEPPPPKKPEEVCCNQCGGMYEAQLGDRLHVQFTGLPGCTGMDCNYHCEPFGTKPTQRYRFVGKNDFKPVGKSGAIYATSWFTVEKVCRAAP